MYSYRRNFNKDQWPLLHVSLYSLLVCGVLCLISLVNNVSASRMRSCKITQFEVISFLMFFFTLTFACDLDIQSRRRCHKCTARANKHIKQCNPLASTAYGSKFRFSIGDWRPSWIYSPGGFSQPFSKKHLYDFRR